jgi:hypothetical protein
MKISFQKSNMSHVKSLVIVASSFVTDNFPVRVRHLQLPTNKPRKFHRTSAALNGAEPRNDRGSSSH